MSLMRDERRKEERSKQDQTNNKAKQHSTPKAVTFPKMYIYEYNIMFCSGSTRSVCPTPYNKVSAHSGHPHPANGRGRPLAAQC